MNHKITIFWLIAFVTEAAILLAGFLYIFNPPKSYSEFQLDAAKWGMIFLFWFIEVFVYRPAHKDFAEEIKRYKNKGA